MILKNGFKNSKHKNNNIQNIIIRVFNINIIYIIILKMSVDLTKYNTAAKICGQVWTTLKDNIVSGKILDIQELEQLGNSIIETECNKIYKREKNKGIAFPTSISLNNCVGNYLYEPSKNEFNKIKSGDIVKIELGVNISGCIAILGETIIYNETDNTNHNYIQIINLLNDLPKNIIKMIKPGEINDDIKMFIESKCTELNCFPVENTISYQHLDGQLNTQESKYILTHYQKYYDEDDNLISEENLCFEFLENEIYTINLTVIPNNEETEIEHIYSQPHESHIYRFNEYYYNLKLKSSREFCSEVKGRWGTNAFNGTQYKDNVKYRLGIKESLENGILTEYPIYYSKDNLPVFHKKFTIVITKDKSLMLKYT